MRIPLPDLYGSVLVGLFACLWAFTFAEHLIAAEDGALYYVLGKALYLGEEYVSINTPMATPVNSPPLGYPALIATTMALWSSDMIAIRTANAGYLGTTWVLRRALANRSSWLAASRLSGSTSCSTRSSGVGPHHPRTERRSNTAIARVFRDQTCSAVVVRSTAPPSRPAAMPASMISVTWRAAQALDRSECEQSRMLARKCSCTFPMPAPGSMV